MKTLIYFFDSENSLRSLSKIGFLANRAKFGLRVVGVTDDTIPLPPESASYFDRFEHLPAVPNANDPGLLDPHQAIECLRSEMADPSQVRVISYGEYTPLVAAAVREAYGVHGASVNEANAFRNKLLMKHLASQHVRVPKNQPFDRELYLEDSQGYLTNLHQTLGTSLILKPQDASSALATLLLHSGADNRLRVNQALNSYAGRFEVEQFIDGDLYSCETVFSDGRPLVSFVSQYNQTVLEMVESGSCFGAYPLALNDAKSVALSAFAQAALSGFGAVQGLTHTEILVERGSGDFYFLETANRAPGGRVLDTYQAAFGVPVLELDQKIKAGLAYDVPTIREGRPGFWFVVPSKAGRVVAVHNPASPMEARFYKKPGDSVSAGENFEGVSALVYGQAESFDSLAREFEAATQFTYVQMERKDCLVLVASKRSTFTDYVIGRKDLDLVLLCFDDDVTTTALVERWRHEVPYFFTINSKQSMPAQIEAFRQFLAKQGLGPQFFCNPNETMQAAAQRVARELALPSLSEEQVQIVRDKVAMKTFYRRVGIAHAAFKPIEKVSEIAAFALEHGYPVILKPVDSDSCIETYKISSTSEIPLALDASRRWMVEEFIQGKEFQVCSLVHEGKVVATFTASNPAPILSVFEGAMNANVTLASSEKKPAAIESTMQKIVSALGMQRGYLHGEFFVTDEGGFIMSEIAARMSGCEAPMNHSLAYGFDFLGAVLDCYLGKNPALQFNQHRSVGDLLLPAKPGKVMRISSVDELSTLPGVLSCSLLYRVGDEVVPRRSSGFCSGTVHVEGQTSAEVIDRMQNILDRYEMECA